MYAARHRCATLVLLALAACQAGEDLATDIPYQGDDAFALGGRALRLDGQRILGADGQPLVERLVTPPVRTDSHLCAADEGADGLGVLRCWDSDLRPVQLALGGRPGRLAIAGGMVAWVASPGGLPQVFVAPVDGSAAPRALTNVELDYTPGQAPEGFVPPPLGQSLRFDGDWLRWDSPVGPQAVRWR